MFHLEQCINKCSKDAKCLAVNYETGLCVLFSHSADSKPGKRRLILGLIQNIQILRMVNRFIKTIHMMENILQHYIRRNKLE